MLGAAARRSSSLRQAVEVGEPAAAPSPAQIGLFHFCFDVVDESALAALHRKLRAAGAPVSDGVDHTIMHSLLLQDPDGNLIELGVDVPSERWVDRKNAFAEDRPHAL